MTYYGWEQLHGNLACIANVIRICARYGNIRILEDEYGINMSLVEAWAKGGEGARDLAKKVVALCEEPEDFKFTYELEEDVEYTTLKFTMAFNNLNNAGVKEIDQSIIDNAVEE